MVEAKKLYQQYKLQDPVIFQDDFRNLSRFLKKMGLENEIAYWKGQVVARN